MAKKLYNKPFKELHIISLTFLFFIACSNNEENNLAEEELTNNVEDESSEVLNNKSDNEEEVEKSVEMADPFERLYENPPSIPQTTEEFTEYPTGPMAGQDFESSKTDYIDFVKSYLPPLDAEATEDEITRYWEVLVYLTAEEYPNPYEILNEIQIDSFGDPELEDTRYQFKEQINVLIALDVSGSMAAKIDGRSMMEIAKEAIRDFISEIPEEVNVGLRVYGHEGDNTNDGREISCASSELVYDIQPFNESEFNQVLETFEPTGWTPIALTLEEAQKDLEAYPGEENTNLLYLVSDGIETCDGEPVAVAEALSKSGIEPIINVIGFNVDHEAQQQLREMADAGGGTFSHAGNEEQLREEFNRAEEMLTRWEEWKQGAFSDAELQRSEQRSEIISNFANYYGEAYRVQQSNLRGLINELSGDHIAQELHREFQNRSSETMNRFLKLQWELRDEIWEEIDRRFEDALHEIEEEFEEGTED